MVFSLSVVIEAIVSIGLIGWIELALTIGVLVRLYKQLRKG